MKKPACGMLLLVLCGTLRADDRYDNRHWRREARESPLVRLRYDLDRAEANSRPYRHDRGRFERVRREMAEFDHKWFAGRYDHHELRDVIHSLEKLLDSRALSHRDRQVLAGDLHRLREFR